jgi:hypothetical protein
MGAGAGASACTKCGAGAFSTSTGAYVDCMHAWLTKLRLLLAAFFRGLRPRSYFDFISARFLWIRSRFVSVHLPIRVCILPPCDTDLYPSAMCSCPERRIRAREAICNLHGHGDKSEIDLCLYLCDYRDLCRGHTNTGTNLRAPTDSQEGVDTNRFVSVSCTLWPCMIRSSHTRMLCCCPTLSRVCDSPSCTTDSCLYPPVISL